MRGRLNHVLQWRSISQRDCCDKMAPDVILKVFVASICPEVRSSRSSRLAQNDLPCKKPKTLVGKKGTKSFFANPTIGLPSACCIVCAATHDRARLVHRMFALHTTPCMSFEPIASCGILTCTHRNNSTTPLRYMDLITQTSRPDSVFHKNCSMTIPSISWGSAGWVVVGKHWWTDQLRTTTPLTTTWWTQV
jgi:hypothetical protein